MPDTVHNENISLVSKDCELESVPDESDYINYSPKNTVTCKDDNSDINNFSENDNNNESVDFNLDSKYANDCQAIDKETKASMVVQTSTCSPDNDELNVPASHACSGLQSGFKDDKVESNFTEPTLNFTKNKATVAQLIKTLHHVHIRLIKTNILST